MGDGFYIRVIYGVMIDQDEEIDITDDKHHIATYVNEDTEQITIGVLVKEISGSDFDPFMIDTKIIGTLIKYRQVQRLRQLLTDAGITEEPLRFIFQAEVDC